MREIAGERFCAPGLAAEASIMKSAMPFVLSHSVSLDWKHALAAERSNT
ncbi:MAG: hypothetical protein QM477_08155 [Planctomycetota bacterium]